MSVAHRPLAVVAFVGLLLALVGPGTAAAASTTVDRGTMAAKLVSAFGLTATSGVRFKDVPKTGALATAIDKVVTAKIASGCGGGRFCPKATVPRSLMASYLARALRLTVPATETFTDVNSSTSYIGSIRYLVKVGLAIPCATHKFCPTRPITTTETTAFLKKAVAITRIAPAQPVPGNPDGNAPVPAGAGAVDTSSPDHVVGTGTPASCTSAALAAAVAQGGVITFDCGPSPVRIRMAATAKVHNDKPDVVIDGGGLVTLDGQNARRILYMNTCDQSLVWTTDHCQNQAHPTLTLQRLTVIYGKASGSETQDGGGGVFVRGGRFKVVESNFFGNHCAPTGPDVGGAAIQVFSQYDGLPVYVVDSTFGGNACSNGGAISSIGVSWTIVNSLLTGNHAIGSGANPAKSGTPGGGNGGAIYNDGNTMTLDVQGTRIEGNTSNHEGGSGIFYVSNDRSGSVAISGSTLRNNTGDGFSTYPGIFFLGSSITFTDSTVE